MAHRYAHSVTAHELIEFLEDLNPDTEIYANFPDNDVEAPNIELTSHHEEGEPGIAYININDINLRVRDTAVTDSNFDDYDDFDDDDDNW